MQFTNHRSTTSEMEVGQFHGKVVALQSQCEILFLRGGESVSVSPTTQLLIFNELYREMQVELPLEVLKVARGVRRHTGSQCREVY